MATHPPTVEIVEKKIFDVGINDRLPPAQLLMLGLQNVFGMTGMFVFPGLLGRSFDLPPERIAYLYGMTFAACGVITILQSVLLLRLPIIQGPYAGNFAALLAVGHLQRGGLGRRIWIVFCRVACLVRADLAGARIERHEPVRAIFARSTNLRHDRDVDDLTDCQRCIAQLDWRSGKRRVRSGEPARGRGRCGRAR